MSEQLVTFEQVRAACERVFDLRLVSPSRGGEVSLHAEFDAYGDYFTIEARAVHHLDLAGGFTLSDGSLAMMSLEELGRALPRWKHLKQRCFGTALMMWDFDGPFEKAPPDEIFVIVAEDFRFYAGKDWPG